jgi:hypothetical protein
MERDSIDPALLRDDELAHEIFVRKGQHLPQRKAGDLLKIFFEMATDPVDLQWVQALDFEGELCIINGKICEFKDFLADCRVDAVVSARQCARAVSRLLHLKFRVADLIAGSRVKGDKLALLEGFKDQILHLIQDVGFFQTEFGRSTSVPHLPPVPPVHDSVMGTVSCEGAASAPPSLSNPIEPVLVPPVPAISSDTRVQLNSMFQCAKLPNPIDRILDKQTVLSGDTFDSVIRFLKLFVQVRIHARVLGIPDVQVLLILYPYTVGVLATRLAEAVSSRVSLDHFHQDTLRFFFPPRARASLQQKYCYRVQAEGELLPNYIADIRA